MNGVERPKIARLNADGSLDATFDARLQPEPTGFVSALAIQDVDPSFDVGLEEMPVVVWGAGDTSDKTITLMIRDDDLIEGDETVIIAVVSSGGATVSPAPLTLTITDNEATAPASDRHPAAMPVVAQGRPDHRPEALWSRSSDS